MRTHLPEREITPIHVVEAARWQWSLVRLPTAFGGPSLLQPRPLHPSLRQVQPHLHAQATLPRFRRAASTPTPLVPQLLGQTDDRAILHIDSLKAAQ